MKKMKTNTLYYPRVYNVLFLVLFSVIGILTLPCCSGCNGGSDTADSNEYTVDITYNATYPEVSTYYGHGEATLYDYGDHATISGTITVGGSSFDADFEGNIEGNNFIPITTNFQVQYEFNGVTYTEDTTIDFNAFSILGDEVSATGEYTAVTNPGNTNESSTVTFVATKIRNLNSNTITDL